MNIEEFREYCLKKKGVTEEFPFDDKALVFKVCGKMFALTNVEGEFRVNLKCNPEKAVTLREEYPDAVLPGYHMSKKHWNTILMNGCIQDKHIYSWIDDSYNLVVEKLTKKQKDILRNN